MMEDATTPLEVVSGEVIKRSLLMQIIRHQRGRDIVCLQVPFSNVAKCSYEVTDTERRIGIDLSDPDDPATYLKGENLTLNKELKGWHYVLEGGYQTGVAAIHKKLIEKMGLHGSGSKQ
jgi:hypothetical protein